MRWHWIGGFVVLAFVAAIAAQTGSPQPGRTEEDVAKELKKLREQIDELVKKEQALKKELQARKLQKEREIARLESERRKKEEAERKVKEEAEKKKHVAKVEIRGKLTKTTPPTFQQGAAFQVMINELHWTLHFGGKKEMEAFAEKNVGKGVIVTGTVVNTRPPVQTWPGINPGWPPNPGWPNPGWPNPDPWNRWPQPFPYHVYSSESPVVIQVDSMKVAED
jgi:hypothetical protein